jgi:hypothetical protein
MTRWFLHSSIALALAMSAVLSPPRPAKAQDAAMLQREDDDEERLRRWMAVRASRSPDTGWFGGVAIGMGALAIGAGIAVPVLVNDAELNLTLPSVGLIALGAVEIGLGVVMLVAPNVPRDEYHRIPTGPLSEREIGRLEGLIRHDAELAAFGRQMLMWSGIGFAVGGLGAMPVVALEPPSSVVDLSLSWGFAGASAFIGVLYVIMSLFETPQEGDWRDYQRGLMPRETPQISVRPTGNGFAVNF